MKYLYFIFCIFLVGACSNRSYKDTLFCELDKEIQDTLLFINQHCFEEGYVYRLFGQLQIEREIFEFLGD